jgi:L-ascorbate metabolism protein UlaG (beta-lactamase superfamily)
VSTPRSSDSPPNRPARNERDSNTPAFFLSHGGSPKLPKNLGLLVEIDGVKIVHLGDAEQMSANFEPHSLMSDAIDVALVPYWYFGSEAGSAIVTDWIRPRHVVAVHIQPGKERGVREGTKDLGYEVIVLDPASRWTLPRER